jgi:hypothetical protein
MPDESPPVPPTPVPSTPSSSHQQVASSVSGKSYQSLQVSWDQASDHCTASNMVRTTHHHIS